MGDLVKDATLELQRFDKLSYANSILLIDRVAALETALKVCEEHTRGIFGAAHPVTIAIQQVKR